MELGRGYVERWIGRSAEEVRNVHITGCIGRMVVGVSGIYIFGINTKLEENSSV